MGKIISAQKWKEIIETIEIHDQGVADMLAITADNEVQSLLKEGEKEIKARNLIPMEEV
jgi:hypothetical protein